VEVEGDLGLTTQHLLSYRLPISPVIRPLPHQQLIGNHSQRIEISAEGMVLPQQHLRSHVARGATGLITIFGLPVSSNAEIGDPGVSMFIEYDIFRFDIAVDDVPLVEMVESLGQAPHQELYMEGGVLTWSSVKG